MLFFSIAREELSDCFLEGFLRIFLEKKYSSRYAPLSQAGVALPGLRVSDSRGEFRSPVPARLQHRRIQRGTDGAIGEQNPLIFSGKNFQIKNRAR